MADKTDCYIGIDSNEGDSLGNIQKAIACLKDTPGIKVDGV